MYEAEGLHHFGKIAQGKMHLSAIGQLAEKFWLEIPEHFPFVLLGVHQIMPNHIHGIITIHKTKINSQTAENDNNGNTIVQAPNLGVCTSSTDTPDSGVSTQTPHNTHNNKQTAAASQKWQPGTLGVIINQYKRVCTIKGHFKKLVEEIFTASL